MLDRSTPNLFDLQPPPEREESDSPTVELEPDRGARAAPSRSRRPRCRRPEFSRATGGRSRRVPLRLSHAARYLPVTVALLLLLSHVFSGGHTRAVAAAVPARTSAGVPVRSASRLRVHTRRAVRVAVAVAPASRKVTHRRGPAPRRHMSVAASVSGSPQPGRSAGVSVIPARGPATSAPPRVTASPPPAPTPPAGYQSGDHTSEFSFEQ
jgi:hypothetical protein